MKYRIKKGKSFISKNRKNFLKILSTSLIAYGLVSAINQFEPNVYDKKIEDKNNRLEEKVVEYVSNIENSAIPDSIVASGNLEDESGYYFKNRILYDANGEIVDLTDDTRNLYFRCVNLDKVSLETMKLNKSKTKVITFSGSSITNDCISSLPRTTKILHLNKCNFLTDLSKLPVYCPNIEMLYLDSTNLDNLDFIYKLPNLKIFNSKESLCVSEDIINYLEENNIETNITHNDILIQNKLMEIIKETISPDMDKKTKIKAVCSYVLEHLEYNKEYIDESNDDPISFALNTNEGVCVSYGHLTNALLNLAGIESYRVDNMNHAWNLVNVDGRYYYIDTTQMDEVMNFNNMLEINSNYMFSPDLYSVNNSSTPVDERLTIISDFLHDDVLKSEIHHNRINKNNVCPEIVNLYLLRLFIIGMSTYQVCSSTKEIFASKKLSLKREGE